MDTKLTTLAITKIIEMLEALPAEDRQRVLGTVGKFFEGDCPPKTSEPLKDVRPRPPLSRGTYGSRVNGTDK